MRLFIVAGEPSGDALGAALMAGIRTLAPGVAFEGVGGPLMRAEGLESLYPMEELSVMGLAEALAAYPRLRRRLHQTAAAVARAAPDALLTIDSPDFCLRLARLSRRARPDLRTVHYVAPSVWAWRPGRAARMARVIDHVLALLPFEPPYMRAAGMTCDFVGHPVVTRPAAGAEAAASFRAAHGIAPDAPLVLALPGSRRGEVARLAPRFGAALRQVATACPGLRVVLPTVAGVADLAGTLSAQWPGRPVVIDPRAEHGEEDKSAAFAAADAAVAASGTVSLELAAAAVPMVIAYDMAPLTWAMMVRMMRIDTVTLVNLVSETRAVPEFLGPDCRADAIAPALARLLDGGAERAAQQAAMALTMERLGRDGEPPGLRAARSVLNRLQS
ncbi:lipid-A-disaccharide synthase [Rhodobacteraceae bacterium WD3A24]|nr:lipid-A-disaccharide synthase [Rhodobacteraceae bacterium WD3A24]